MARKNKNIISKEIESNSKYIKDREVVTDIQDDVIERIEKKEKIIPVPDIKDNPYSEEKEIICKDTGEICKGNEYFNTQHWKQLKKDLYCLRSGICQMCHDHVWFTMSRVHHLSYDHLGSEYKKDIMLLCVKCHSKIHGLSELDIKRRRWLINQKRMQKHGESIPPYAIEGYAELETENDLEWWFNIEKSKLPATDKQIKFAKLISETLNVELPESNTKDNYRDFISKYVDLFNKKKKAAQ